MLVSYRWFYILGLCVFPLISSYVVPESGGNITQGYRGVNFLRRPAAIYQYRVHILPLVAQKDFRFHFLCYHHLCESPRYSPMGPFSLRGRSRPTPLGLPSKHHPHRSSASIRCRTGYLRGWDGWTGHGGCSGVELSDSGDGRVPDREDGGHFPLRAGPALLPGDSRFGSPSWRALPFAPTYCWWMARASPIRGVLALPATWASSSTYPP